MIAALGMYDRAETAAAHDRYWALIRDGLRAQGIAAPEGLTRGPGAYWPAWQDKGLVLGQTCGLPYRSRLHGLVTLVGTPDFGLEGCAPGYYRSALIARADDPRADLAAFQGGILAYNEGLSQSGWAAPLAHAAAQGLRLRPGLASGGHRLSALAVAEGRADFAAIDARTWAILTKWEDFTRRLRVFDWTTPTPGLPYIAAPGAPAEPTFAAVAAAIAALSADDRDLLGLKGLVAIPAEAYLALPIPPAPEQLAHEI